jgi:hypothetical protein
MKLASLLSLSLCVTKAAAFSLRSSGKNAIEQISSSLTATEVLNMGKDSNIYSSFLCAVAGAFRCFSAQGIYLFFADLSFTQHDAAKMKKIVDGMTLEEAMKVASHLIPKEVQHILAQGSIVNQQAPASADYNGLQGVVDRINEMYLSTFKDLGDFF